MAGGQGRAQDVPAYAAPALDALAEGRYAAAERGFRYLLDNERGSARRTGGYLTAISEAATQKGWQLSGRFALRPSTNVLRQTTTRIFATDIGTFYIPDSETKKSGIGATLGGTARRSFGYAPGRIASVEGRLDVAAYKVEELQSLTGALRADHEWLAPGRSLTLGAEVGTTRYRDLPSRLDPDYVTFSGFASGRFQIQSDVTLSADAVVSHYAYDGKPVNDGTAVQLAASVSQVLDPLTSISFGAGTIGYEAGADYLSFRSLSVNARVNRMTRQGLFLSVDAALDARDYQANYPAFAFPRRDRTYSLGLTVGHQKVTIRGAMPTVGCRYSTRASNVPLFDFDSVDCFAGLSRTF